MKETLAALRLTRQPWMRGMAAGLVMALAAVIVQGQAQKTEPSNAGRGAAIDTRAVAIEDLLPAETLAFAATSNLSAWLGGTRRLEAFRVLAARLPKAEREGRGGLLAEALGFLSFGLREAGVLDETRLGCALFKQNGQLSGAPERAPSQASKASAKGLHFLFFVEATNLDLARQARAQFLTYFSEKFSDLGKPENVKQVKYRGVIVEQFKSGYVGAMIGATYVLGHADAVESLLALRTERDAAHLSDDLNYARARSQLPASAELFAYLQGPLFAEQIAAYLAKETRVFETLPIEHLVQFDAIKTVAFASSFEREGVVDRVVVAFDPARKHWLTSIFADSVSEFRAHQYVPLGTETLISLNLDPPRAYDELLAPCIFGSMAQFGEGMQEVGRALQALGGQGGTGHHASAQEQVSLQEAQRARQERIAKRQQNISAGYERDLGFKFREKVERGLSGEAALAINFPRVNSGPQRAEGDSALILGLRDREAAREAMLKLLVYLYEDGHDEATETGDEAQRGGKEKSAEQLRQEQERRAAAVAELAREVYKGAEIFEKKALFFPLALGFTGNHLIISESSEAIKRLLDTSDGGASITLDPNFRAAMSGAPGSVAGQIYISPKLFDEMLGDFLRLWLGRAAEQDDVAIAVPATLAAFIEPSASSIRVEAFSPIGLPGLIGTKMLGAHLETRTIAYESEAYEAMQRIVEAEKAYAARNRGRYATLDELIKAKLVAFDFAKLKEKEQSYRYELKLKANAAGYEATATPVKYGRQGRLSFFVDEAGKIRQADKNGEPATVKN
jgi:hypothetical protein